MSILGRFLGLSAVLCLSFAVHAQISINPPGPTDEDAVTLYVVDDCLRHYTMVRTGFEIRVVAGQPKACPSPPVDIPNAIPLGELPAGQYRVTAQRVGGDETTMTFVVRADQDLPARLRPWAIPTTGALVYLDPRDFNELCPDSACSALRVEIFGNVYTAQDLRRSATTYAIQAPPHAAGPVDMRVTYAGGTFNVPAALYYYAQGPAPDPSVFERVLFPVLFASDGANGSRWRSEVVIANPNDWAVQNYNTIEPIVCVTFPCGELLERRSQEKFEGEGFPRGAALHVPRGEADELSFSLRIRDISRDAESHGTQVPVVREREMYFDTEVPLLDVPRDPRYRVKVRIYAFPDPVYVTTTPHVLVWGSEENPVPLSLTRSCNGAADCARTPYYGELDLAPGARGQTSDLYVELRGAGHGWAFASVTNNTTQQVTVIAPDGHGPRPGNAGTP